MLKNNCHHCNHLQNSFNKYGIENFKFTHKEYTVKEKLLELEQYYLSKYIIGGKVDHSKCYNSCPTAGSNMGFKHTEESKKKISLNNGKGKLGKEVSIETRKKLSEAKKGNEYWLGKKHSKETIAKLKGISKDRRPSDKCIARSIETRTGRKQSMETVQKRVESRLGYAHSNETKKKMSESRKCLVVLKKVTNLDTEELFDSIEEAANAYKVSKSSISRWCRDIRYSWEYV